MSESKQLYIRKLSGGNKTPVYPETIWTAIVDRPSIPEKLSELQNDSSYITQDELEQMSFLPEVSNDDNGKILKVQNGQWTVGEDLKLSIAETSNNAGGNTLTIGG